MTRPKSTKSTDPRDPSIGEDQVTPTERARRLDGRPFSTRDETFRRVGADQTGPCAPLAQAEKDAVNARLAAERAAKPEPVGLEAHVEAFVLETCPLAPRSIKNERGTIFAHGWRAHARVAEADHDAHIEANRTSYETRIRELEREIGAQGIDIELLEEWIDELETDGSAHQ
jgi:hypothetical protein